MGIRNSICDVSDQAFKGEIDRERERRKRHLTCYTLRFPFIQISGYTFSCHHFGLELVVNLHRNVFV